MLWEEMGREFGEEDEKDEWRELIKPYLRELFKEKKEDLFWTKELQIGFEKIKHEGKTKTPFHWVIYHALQDLENEGFLIKEKMGNAVFYRHRSYRYYKRRMKEKLELIEENSKDDVSDFCGTWAENLFKIAFGREGFTILKENFNSINGKKWKKTDHDLDIAVEKDNLIYGVEIKNQLKYIDKEQLEIKMDICKYLDIIPVFLVRNSPSTRNYDLVISNGGFIKLFMKRIYPPPYRELVEKLKKETLLKDAIEIRSDVSDTFLNNFLSWHEKKIT